MVDLRTLLFLVAAADAATAVVIAYGAGRRLRQGVGLWIAALICRALAVAALAAGIQPPAHAFAIGSALLALSMTLQGASLLAYDGRKLPAWVHTAVLAGVAIPFALLGNDAANAVLFGGIAFGTILILLAAIAVQVHPSVSGRARARNVLVIMFSAGAVVFYIRGVSVMLVSDPLQPFVNPGPFQSALFVIAAGAALVSTLGFMLLQKERAEGEALRMATMDPLTGAYNRRTFHEIGEREMSRARRAGQPLSIIMVDIDHFRPVNESHGNRAGDEMLQKVADLIRSALRKEDMLVRYGGEEFLVMLPEVPGPGAVVVAGRIRKAVEAQPLRLGSDSVAATVSVGVSARLDEGPESMESLIARAEEALALAKQRGRNRVVALSLGRSIAA
ncbi:MAG TPA: GGDEF domain-containing protein [Usitatibacter sp.]|jgi:diguanylate cyclase (GGDEF)-like protein|nr:GGDEF domain-containing protein [Usitatibacter sp.]